eukprot:1262457-Prymnesium_polylepis.1
MAGREGSELGARRPGERGRRRRGPGRSAQGIREWTFAPVAAVRHARMPYPRGEHTRPHRSAYEYLPIACVLCRSAQRMRKHPDGTDVWAFVGMSRRVRVR